MIGLIAITALFSSNVCERSKDLVTESMHESVKTRQYHYVNRKGQGIIILKL